MTLSNRRRTGEIARAKLLQYGREWGFGNLDHCIKWLEQEGFILVSRDPPPARRGNKVKKYEGPTMLGKSHSETYVVPASASHGPR